LSVPVGKISGIEIRLHYSWFIILIILTWSLAVGYLPGQYPNQSQIFYWTVGAIAAMSLFLSVLIHEVAHSIIARKNSIAVRRITLHFFGGVSEIEEEAREPGVEMKMAAAGPLTSLVLGLIFLGFLRVATSYNLPLGLEAIFRYAAYINLILAVFNMTPAFPMDGGRILRAFLWRRSGNLLESTGKAVRVSVAFSYFFIFIGLLQMLLYSVFDGLWIFVIGLFIKNSADANMNEAMISEVLRGVKVGDIMTKEVHPVDPELSIQRLVDYHFKVYKHSGFPVVLEDRLVGIVTDEDVRRVLSESWDEVKVEDIMKPFEELVTVEPEDSVSDALIKMAKNDIGRLPVLEDNKIVGIVTRSDVTKTIKIRLQFRS